MAGRRDVMHPHHERPATRHRTRHPWRDQQIGGRAPAAPREADLVPEDLLREPPPGAIARADHDVLIARVVPREPLEQAVRRASPARERPDQALAVNRDAHRPPGRAGRQRSSGPWRRRERMPHGGGGGTPRSRRGMGRSPRCPVKHDGLRTKPPSPARAAARSAAAGAPARARRPWRAGWHR